MATEERKTKGQRTQERIVQEALNLFGENGFEKTSMQMIADACDLSQGAVMQHFSSKARLLEAVRRSVSNSNHEFVDSQIAVTDDSYTALRKHILGNLDWALRNPAEANVIVLVYEQSFHDEDQKQTSAGAIRLGTERIFRYVLSSQREHLIDKKLDAELAAETLHTYLVGLILRTVASTKLTKINKATEEKIDFFLKSVLKPL